MSHPQSMMPILPGIASRATILARDRSTMSSPRDICEQEADHLAARAARSPECPETSPTHIRRFSGGGETAATTVGQAMASPGGLLGDGVRQDMEQRFGHDFSRVRVHSGGGAERSVHEVNARAYTLGHNLVFGPGRFAPGTAQGQRLLAHDLTHVVRQSGRAGGEIPVQRQTPAAPASAKAEAKTEEAADAEAQAKPEEASGDQSLSPVRKRLFELFGQFEKKVIGDAVFAKIETEEHWKAQNRAEADATFVYEAERKNMTKR